MKRQRLRAKDLEQVLIVAKRAGLTVSAVEIATDGRVTVRFGETVDPTEAELDEELRLWRLRQYRQDQQQPKKR